MKRAVLSIFILAVMGVLVSDLGNIRWLQIVAKPIIMLSLLVYYLIASTAENRSRMTILAIVFSLVGDVLLMEADYFIPGLSAFLIAHLFYIAAYRHHRTDESNDALRGIHRVRLAFPIILAGSGLVVVLYPTLGDMRIPVIVYALVISVMAVTALLRYGRTSPASFWMVLSGAVLFMASDSLIAINKFLTPIALSGVLIMLTYSAAQLLIVMGLLQHPQE